jgi:hypothetical protein
LLIMATEQLAYYQLAERLGTTREAARLYALTASTTHAGHPRSRTAPVATTRAASSVALHPLDLLTLLALGRGRCQRPDVDLPP